EGGKWREGRDLGAEGILDDFDIRCRHRDANRHFIETELRRFPGRDTEIAVNRGDQSPRDCVPVDRRDGWPWILENPKISSLVLPIPLADFGEIAASKDVEAVLEIDPRR